MEIKEGSCLPPSSDRTIHDFERHCRVSLPAELVHILKNHNGSVPTRNVFLQGDRDRIIERFLCLLDDHHTAHGWYDIRVVSAQIEDRLSDDPDLVGMNVMPIAALFGGDFLCLDYRNDAKTPCVVVWDHELSDVDKPHLEEVGKSLEDFLKCLTS